MADVPTPEDLQTLLVTVLAGVAGGSPTEWGEKLGPVTKLPIHSNVRSNWAIEPPARGLDLETITKAAEVVRARHPYVAG